MSAPPRIILTGFSGTGKSEVSAIISKKTGWRLIDTDKLVEERAPLRRNIDQDEVADAGVFLASHLSRGITGEVIHVDAGFHIMGM